MPAINFKPQFEDKILSGIKTLTIRKNLPRGLKSYNTPVRLYTGQRTKQCRLIKEVVVNDFKRCFIILKGRKAGVWIDTIGYINVDNLATRDGFASFGDFLLLHNKLDNITFITEKTNHDIPLWVINWGNPLINLQI